MDTSGREPEAGERHLMSHERIMRSGQRLSGHERRHVGDDRWLYTDDLTRLGLFAADAWRAGRLVVDTGLHAMGWTRAEAVEWLRGAAPTPLIEIESEVDRYISYPGQALAYMVGRREIFRLRQAATDRLGSAFDLKEFHDVILRAGSLPLPALAGTVERWMERATAGAAG